SGLLLGCSLFLSLFFLCVPPPPQLLTLSLHDALPISYPVHGAGRSTGRLMGDVDGVGLGQAVRMGGDLGGRRIQAAPATGDRDPDREWRMTRPGTLSARPQQLARYAEQHEQHAEQVEGPDPAIELDRRDDQHAPDHDGGTDQSEEQRVHGSPEMDGGHRSLARASKAFTWS